MRIRIIDVRIVIKLINFFNIIETLILFLGTLFLQQLLAEYKLPQLVTIIELELPLQWETDKIPPFRCWFRQIFIYICMEILLF